MADRGQVRNDHPDSWVAVTEGDTLEGTVMDVTEAYSDQRARNGNGYYPLLTLEKITEATGYNLDKLQTLKVHCFGAVLYNEVMRHQPEVGERIRILYVGTAKEAKKGQNPAELYKLTVAGRKDQAQRAYGRITDQNGPTQRRGAQPPVDAADFAPRQETLAEQSEDIPF